MINRLKDYLNDFETRNFLVFYLLCKFRFRYYSAKKIKKYQRKKIGEQVAFAAGHSAFFKKYYAGHSLDDFSALPTVNKQIMMENLTEYNTVGLTKKEIIDFCLEIEKSRDFSKKLNDLNIGMSSGTSGNKGVEIVSLREENYMKAALISRFDFPKGEKINLAFILRVSAPAFNLNRFGHRLTYISQLNSIEKIREQLEMIRPNVVSAPPSMLKIIAREIENKRLSIKPKRIVSYAEILYPDVKDYLFEIFQCPIHEIYKCTEGPIAITCRCGKLHINEDLVLVEALNDDGTKTEPGQPCQKMIITDLHKKSQPIIRYELNDIITISPEKCACGSSFRVIEKIQGRSNDLFWSKNLKTKKWQFIIPDYVSRAVISSSEMIDEYQVIQNSPQDILVRLQLKNRDFEKSFEKSTLIENLNSLFREYGCALPEIKVVFKDPKNNSNSNKLIRIQRNFEINENEE